MKEYNSRQWWNFWFLLLSIAILVGEIWFLIEYDRLPTSIGFFDLALITLATFRLTRLFVYDSIMEFVRDWFLKVTFVTIDGETMERREKFSSGARRVMSDLLSCPWCTGLQVAMLVVFLYYISPISWIIITMFAVAGVATFIQLLTNAIGWQAEHLKRKTEAIHPEEHLKGSSGGTCG